MIYIKNQSGKEIHFASKIDSIPNVIVNQTFEIAICGDEIEHFRLVFPNLPDRKFSDCLRFFGDHAKFIVANWGPY